MKTKHTATAFGHTFTRTSESRVYSHMVVGVESIAALRVEADKLGRSQFRMNRSYYEQLAKGGTYVGEFADKTTYTTPITADEQARAIASLAKGADGHAADRVAEFDKRMESAWKTPDGLNTVYSAGWCSRLDLAMKLASKIPGGTIVEATKAGV